MKQAQDKFYTDPEIALHCINTIEEQFDLWLEPSAGSGSFLHQLPDNRLGLDIIPDAVDVRSQDFLLWTPDLDCSICTIGNPPFGKNSAMAISFFQHAAKFSDMIAFIVPRTWSRDSFQNRLPLNWQCVYEELLPDRIFKMQGKLGEVDFAYPCVWQIWTPTQHRRKKFRAATVHSDWKWTTRENANWVLRRTGGLAGTISQNFDCADEGNYFIACDDVTAHRLQALYTQLREVANQSAYPNLPKSEVVRIYSEN